jgi:hypothetical protein
VDAGALDDLDLDGMFAEQGDLLFDGFEMELEGIHDIVGSEIADKKKRTGPKTNRTNPMIQPGENGPKRRKTKRKSKAPSAYGDDELEDEEINPKLKKRRTAARKGKMAPVPLTKKVKSSKKKESSALSQAGRVAAAGQFGGRTKRNSGGIGSQGTKKRSKSNQKNKDALPDLSSTIPMARPPKLEPTYCGLLPSKTVFYPFMEAVPAQPNLKNKKLYPAVDKIFGSFTSRMMKSSNALDEDNIDANLDMDSPIFKLLAETFTSISERERTNFNNDKKVALLKAIPHLRKFIDKYDRTKLVTDVYALLGLLNRQHSFLKVCLNNMQSWCQTEFSPRDYKATYQPEIRPRQRSKWKSGVVKVKINLNGFKEPKGTQYQLLALLPLSVVSMPLSMNRDSSAGSIAPKKKKKVSSSSSANSILQGLIPVAPKTYANCLPQERRRRVLGRLSKLATQLADQQKKALPMEKIPPKITIPPPEEILSTNKMWEFMDEQGFHKLSSEEILDKFSSLAVVSKLPPMPSTIRGSSKEEISSNSLFDRLHSLLVEENDDDSESEIDDSSLDSDSEEESLSFLDDDDDDDDPVDDPMQAKQLPVADLSQLNLEERTFIQLSIAGLVSQKVYPEVELILAEDKEETNDDFNNTLANMTTHLAQMEKTNNARVAFLETCLDRVDVPYTRSKQEEQSSLIAKCQNLIQKRNKEKAKKHSSKKKDDSLNLPW